MGSAGAMNENLEFDSPGLPLPLTGRTSLFAIIGDPIAQVGSPGLFNSFFRKRQWQAVLVPLHVKAADLAEALRGLRHIRNLRGLVLTTPHKTAGLELVDEIGPEAKLVRSINAVCCGDDGHWRGENFDGLGCVRGLRNAGLAVSGKSVLIVGTGGAGRAVATAIAREGPAQLMLHDLDRSLASRVCGDLRAAFAGIQAQSGEPDPRGYDIAINCTPIGMAGSPGLPFEPTLLDPGTVVVDLVVEPEMTELLRVAAAKGCFVHPGRRTLEGQVEAVCAFFEGEGHG
jgi:shikimate dehydrogenase